MNRHLAAGARAAGIAVALLLAGSVSPLAAPGEGANITGTWWLVGQYGPGMTLPTLVTYHADGTSAASDSIMFGGIPGFPFKITPLHGVWKRTGPGQFGVTSLMLGFDPATNMLVAIGRARADIRFDGDFDHLAGMLYGELLFCPTPFSCPNPTDPAAPWITTTPPVPFTAIRVRRVPAGLLP